MEGTEENKDPRAFMNADPAAVAAQLRAIIDEVKPDAVVTFGPDGGYGHPDHKMICRTATAAVLTAAWETPALYYTAMPRELFEELVKRAIGPFADMPPETVAAMGTPSAEIDVWIDVQPELDRKWASLMAHRTQMSPDGPMAGVPKEDVTAAMGVETFRRIALPWRTPDRGLLDLLPEGPHTRLPQRETAAR
jgi:N-acetyl-1-D-myo-inositol-2-amino-2-deoxy-alpha-D-glucopyranoside deacetylase